MENLIEYVILTFWVILGAGVTLELAALLWRYLFRGAS